jgi:hypothetical protein
MSTDNSTNPTWVEAVKTAFTSMMAEMFHTCMPGVIESYDSTERKAKVTPLLKRKYLNGNEIEYKPIDNVPVMFFGSGSAGLRLQEQDYVNQTCLLIFCERSIDFWKAKGELTVPGNNRKFSTSDAIALVGLNSFNNTDEGGKDLQLFANDSTITIKEDSSVVVENSNGSYELKANGQFAVNGTHLTVEP